MSLVRLTLLALAALLVVPGAHAQIAFRAASSAGVASVPAGTITDVNAGAAATDDSTGCNNTVSPAMPTGLADDVLVALVNSREDQASVNVTAGTGWSLAFSRTYGNGGDDLQAYVYYKVATGTNTAADPLTLTQSGSCNSIAARVSRFRGVDTAQPLETFPVPAGNFVEQGSGSLDTGTQVTTLNGSMLLVAGFINDNRTVSEGGGWSESFDSDLDLNRDLGLSLHYMLQATAGSASVSNWDLSGGGGDENIGVIFALRPRLSGLTIAKPAGTVAGDVMVASIAVRPDTVLAAPPAGWVAALDTPQAGGNSSRMATFYKVATGAEPASYTFAFSGTASTGAAGGILTFSGVDTASPLDVAAGNTTPSDVDHTAGAVTTTVVGAMLVGSFEYTSIPSDWSPPAGMAEAVDEASTTRPNGNGISLEMAYAAQAPIGSTGSKQASSTPDGGADTGVAHLVALRPLPTVRFDVSAGATALACPAFPHAVTIVARDASGNLLPSYTGLVSITTSTAIGDWSALVASGIFNNGAAGDGAATYQFAAADNGAVQLGLSVTATGTLTVRVQDATTGFADVSAPIDFVDDGYVIVLDPVQVAGRPQAIVVERRRAPGCGLATGQGHGGNNQVKLWLTLDPSHPAGASLPSAVGATTVNPLPTAEPGGNNITLDFGGAGALARGQAPLTLNTTDVGKYVLNVRDGNSQRRGTSAPITARPFSLAVRGADAATAIQHGTTAASPVLAAAGADFTATVAAYLWQAGDDSNDDGVADAGADVTDNGLAPRYAWDTVLSPVSNLPGVALGALNLGAGAPTFALASFAGGAATAANLRYSEAGNVFMQADATTYLASPGVNVTGGSGMDGSGAAGGYVGRFKPKHFVVSGAPTLANRAALACASSFTYLNEGLQLGFTLEARNAQNVLTQNYTGAYAKLNLAGMTNLGIGARSGATILTPRIDNALAPGGSFANGIANLSAVTGIRRASPDGPDGPYTATQFGIAPNDNDPNAAAGVQMQAFDLDADGGIPGNDHFAIAPTTELRYGRLRLQNAYGPVGQALPIALEAQYWNGSGFVSNALDDCTTLARANIALAFTGVIAPCNTFVQQASIAFASGSATLTLSAPGAGNSGTVLLTPQLGSAAGTYCPASPGGTAAATASPAVYLLGRWDDAANPDADGSTSYDDKPAGQAGFGLYGSQPKNFIFFRENY